MKTYSRDKGIIKLVKKFYYSPLMKWPKSIAFNVLFKNMAHKRIREVHGRPFKVIFFVLNAGMWKYESLFKLLLADNQFNPVIIPYSLPWYSKEQQKKFQNEVIEYCKSNGFPYLIAYNIDEQSYIPADELQADFVSYSQPYNNCHEFWRLEKFWNTALVFNYPYGLPLENKEFNNLLLHNIAWRNFFPSDCLKHVYTKNRITHGDNYFNVGNVIYDRISANNLTDVPWKDKGHGKKRIIWAPHHTIGDNDTLPFSTFLLISDAMVSLAQKYEASLEIAFKPHPILRERLYEIWGESKTEKYYKLWHNMPNTILALGDYVSLFKSSDAMIHDCSGFMLDYLYTLKPVLFVSKNKTEDYLSSYALKCYKLHYHGATVDDIENFITDVVMGGNDSMYPKRYEFYQRELLPPNDVTAANNMYSHFKAAIS